MNDILSSLSLSVRIAVAATVLTMLIAVPLAYWMARVRFHGAAIIEAIIMLPLVLPPTVVGYLILITFGRQGFPGRLLAQAFHYSIVFRFEGAVLAAAIVAAPLVYIPAKAAFRSLNPDLIDSARSCGASRWQLFWRIALPLSQRGIFAGMTLAFARAMGEFGATIMVYGWQPDRVTLPISIYADYEQDNLSHALPATLTLSAVSLALILLYNHAIRRD